MYKLVQHIPTNELSLYCDEIITAYISDAEFLKDVSFVKSHLEDKNFFKLSLSRESNDSFILMAEYNEGKNWHVVGFLDKNIFELPDWSPNEKT